MLGRNIFSIILPSNSRQSAGKLRETYICVSYFLNLTIILSEVLNLHQHIFSFQKQHDLTVLTQL